MSRCIPLTQGQVAVVDNCDYERLSRFKWYAFFNSAGQIYAARSDATTRRTKLMHREILQTPKGVLTDHWDRDGLNNRRNNLRHCSQSQNQANRGPQRKTERTSRFKGVSWGGSKNHSNPWAAFIKCEGRRLNLGNFRTEELAALAYNSKAAELFGEFALLNILEEAA